MEHFKKPEQKPAIEISYFFAYVDNPKLSENQAKVCEEDLIEKDLNICLKSIQNDKSPSNDGLTMEFYQTFWNELLEIFIDSASEATEKGHLSTSQIQAIIKLIKKKKLEI